MSDVNATPESETPATAVVTPEVAAVPVEKPVDAPAPVTGTAPEPAASMNVVSRSSSPEPVAAPAISEHESLLARIEALPADGVTLLHDVLDHVREGVDEFALTVGLGRLKSLFEKVKSRL
jgi:hypothetical protein